MPNPADPTEAELGVLQVLWALGLATIREIRDDLYPEGGTSEYATVQKLLERLEAKGFVRRRRDAIPHTFSATLDRDDLVGNRLTDLADSLCGGSLAPIVSQLMQHRKLGTKERRHLRELVRELDESEREATPKKRGTAKKTKRRSRKR